MPPDPSSRHGILDPHAGEGRFTLTRHDPAPALAAVVERHWIVRWDLRDRPPFEQETLPFPCVNLVFGSHRPGVHGVCTDRFVARLEGQGWVVGTKFRPGGFRRFVDVAIAELTDRVIAIDAAFGGDGAAVDRAVHAAPDDAARLRLVTELLVARGRRDADDATALAVR
ncbi:MAG: AraC family transcriptional regulator, partial [Myxococcales bacterium]|nr:AraC family transcriptional regulator [Myxococcales bacterium]